MKVKDSDETKIEVGRIKPCPFCGSTDNLEISNKETYDKLTAENGSALVKIRCKKCDLELIQYEVPNNEYFFGIGLLIGKWNMRKE